MNEQPDMEKKLEAAMNSLDGIKRATPSPYFYTKVRARLANRNKEWGGIAGLISRPVYALAMVCTVLLINTWIVIGDKQETAAISPKTISTDQLPDEYNVAVATFYEYETP